VWLSFGIVWLLPHVLPASLALTPQTIEFLFLLCDVSAKFLAALLVSPLLCTRCSPLMLHCWQFSNANLGCIDRERGLKGVPAHLTHSVYSS
jgi:hypothetical protein